MVQIGSSPTRVLAETRLQGYTIPMATFTLPNDLAERVAPYERWLPAILEVSLLGLRTPAHLAAAELITFLSSNPSSQEVRAYRLSALLQARVEALLEQNRQGTLGDDDAAELDEFMALEHVVRLIKIESSDTLASA